MSEPRFVALVDEMINVADIVSIHYYNGEINIQVRSDPKEHAFCYGSSEKEQRDLAERWLEKFADNFVIVDFRKDFTP